MRLQDRIELNRGRLIRIASSVGGVVILGALIASAAIPNEGDIQHDPVKLLEAYRHVEAASVSDAEEQLFHEKHYMTHEMRPIFPAKFVGFAITVLLKKEENNDPHALDGMLEAIDAGSQNSVYVMKVEDGIDIAGMGGLMGTAMSSRNFAGAVIEGGVRDLPQLKRIGFPVYAMSVVPSTSVGHYRFGGMNQTQSVGGTQVSSGDIIIADEDGVVVVPRDKAAEILVRAQALDNSEHAMYPFIEKFHSIVKAVREFHRI